MAASIWSWEYCLTNLRPALRLVTVKAFFVCGCCPGPGPGSSSCTTDSDTEAPGCLSVTLGLWLPADCAWASKTAERTVDLNWELAAEGWNLESPWRLPEKTERNENECAGVLKPSMPPTLLQLATRISSHFWWVSPIKHEWPSSYKKSLQFLFVLFSFSLLHFNYFTYRNQQSKGLVWRRLSRLQKDSGQNIACPHPVPTSGFSASDTTNATGRHGLWQHCWLICRSPRLPLPPSSGSVSTASSSGKRRWCSASQAVGDSP